MNDTPALSRLQQGPGQGPEIWMPQHAGPLIALHMRFRYRHHDLCLFHQLIHAGIDDRVSVADAEWTRLQQVSGPVDEWEQLHAARRRESISAHDMETASVRGFAQQTFVVTMWALIEQYCCRTLAAFEALRGTSGAPSPYRWPDVEKRYEAAGIVLSTGKSYEGIRECRIVNNKIKHVGVVDDELAKHTRFSRHRGDDLDAVPIAAQYYADSAFEFVGWCMETADQCLQADSGA